MTTIQPFRIDIPTAVLDDLQQRLTNTRWLLPSKADANWDHGTNMDYLKELADYWQHSYNWEQHGEKVKEWTTGSAEVPAAFALFPKDNSHPPREWAARFFNVQRWTKMEKGAHFTAMEEPELLARDLRAFFRSLRQTEAWHSPVQLIAE